MKNNSINFRKSRKSFSFRKDGVSVNQKDFNGMSVFNLKYNQLERFIKEYK